jgi:putative ABC transport system substrate-binding protein
MQRRVFIAGVGAAAIWQVSARAQQPGMPMVGFLNASSPDGYAPMAASFRDGLKEVGYVEGRNVLVEFRWAGGHYDRLKDMATDLVQRRVSVLVANTPANLVAKEVTSTIPIVFTTSSDPVSVGLVDSMSRPGGNVTGVSQLNVEVGSKRLELAHELMPQAIRIALLINPANAQHEIILKKALAAALELGVDLDVLRATDEREIEASFESFSQSKASVLTIGTDAFFNGQTERLAKLATRYAVPTIYLYREFALAGGLMSYGGSVNDSYRLAGIYVGRILKGERLADLPVQQSTKLELIINLKAAGALNLQVPSQLVARADEIIE